MADSSTFDFEKSHKEMGDKLTQAINDSGEGAKASLPLLNEQRDLLVDAEKRAHKEAAKKNKDELEARANEERNLQLLEGLTGFARATEKFRQKAEKFKKVAAGKVKDFADAKITAIKNSAKSLLDFLVKGLGIAALWAIFKLISETDWEKLLSDVGFWIDTIFTAMTRIGAWLGVSRLLTFLKGTGPLDDGIKSLKAVKKQTTFLSRIGKAINDFFGGKNSIFTKIKTFFSGKGGGGKLMTKLGNLFTSIGGIFGKIPGLGKITSFIKGAAKFLGKIFLPVTVLMGLWEAVTGFMSGFEETEGNLGQKIIGGISGAIQGLIDFFIVDLLKVLQDVIVWLGEFFGFDMSAVIEFDLAGKIGEWLKAPIQFITDMFKWVAGDVSGEDNMFTNLIDFISGVWGSVTSWFTGLWTWASEGIASGWTSVSGYVSKVWSDVKTWFTELFSFAMGEDTDESDDSFLMTTIKNTITGIKEWFGKMFKFDSASDILASAINVLTFFPNLIKDAVLSVTEWLLGLFGFGEEAKAVANAKNFSIGDMIVTLLDKLVTWLSDLFDFDIKKIMAESLGALGDAGKKVMGWLGFGSDEEGKSAATGGPIGAGEPVLVGEHGPELFVPSGSGRILPKMQTETAMADAGGGAPMIINAPTSNVRNGSTSMVMSSSSVNPMHNKYFLNG